MRVAPMPVLLDSRDTSRSRRGIRRKHTPRVLGGESDDKLYTISHMTAPLSPEGGTSTGNSLGIMITHETEAFVASPPSDTIIIDPRGPLIRDGAIIRPPITASAHQTQFRSSSPPVPSMLANWRREQAELKRSMAAASAADLGARAWSRSVGEVPPPRPASFGTEPIRQAAVLPAAGPANERDDGLDIFEALDNGPPLSKGKR